MTERRIERKGSQTAGYTCFSRACAVKETNERFRGPDRMAEIFMPPLAWILLNVSFLRKWCIRRMFPPGMYEYVTARTKLLDAVFVEALSRGFTQIVLLGAGMDTRVLRFRDRNEGATVFDLDIHATQDYKRRIFKRRKTALPASLVFVPIDFTRQSLADALSEAGYKESGKTLFLWEGVTMYLDAAAVDATLSFIRENSGEGSIVAFDYIYASVLRRGNTLYGEQGAYDAVARKGEPWTFGIEAGAVESFLAGRGFTLIEHYTPSELEEAFLTDEDGTRFGRINGTHCIVKARVSRGSS